MINPKESIKSLKQLRIAKNIHRKVAIIFQKDLRGLVTNNLLSVSDVKLSKDSKKLTLYLSFLFDTKIKESFSLLEDNKDLIKRKLFESIKNDLQTMPELIFKLDTSQAEVVRMEQIYNKIQNRTS